VPPSATPLGDGPDIVLLHGVGVGPESFADLADLLSADHRVLVCERLGGAEGAVSLEAQADEVAEAIVTMHAAGACIVGVSGGATVALVLAFRHPGLVGSLVVHEPLVGPHAPELHERFTAAARRAAEGDEGALEVVRAVLGEPTWEALGPDGQVAVAAGAGRARHEVPVFAAFAPSAADLAGLSRFPVLTTVGDQSHPDRRAAAQVLAALAHAEVAVVPGSGNAAQLDAPEAFASLIRRWHSVPLGTPIGG
jgi:pimeloyl-ACP methyl ester carboxylesterase